MADIAELATDGKAIDATLLASAIGEASAYDDRSAGAFGEHVH
jgi:hypothetical protein